MSYVEACGALGVETPPRQGFFSARQKEKPVAQQFPQSELWNKEAQRFLYGTQKNLENIEALFALTERFLTPTTAKHCGIGYNSDVYYPLRTTWGLEEWTDAKGKLHNKMKLPRGLVIATRRRNGVVALTIRLADWKNGDKTKYWQVAGSNNVPFVVGKENYPCLIMESALDAALAYQEAQSANLNIACVAFMGSTKEADKETINFIRKAPCILAVPDYDSAGREAWDVWRNFFPQAKLVPPRAGKDLTEMHIMAMEREGENIPTIGTWLQEALGAVA